LRFALTSGLFAIALTASSFAVCEARTHVVVAGESVAAVAAANHLSPAALARLNDLEGAPRLRPGSVLALDAHSAVDVVDAKTAAANRSRLAQADLALQPTAGADLAMWGAAEPAAAPSVPHAKLAKSSLQRLASRFVTRTSVMASSLTHNAMRFMGVPYVFGGTSRSGFDCSGFVQHVFAMIGTHLPRTADAQYYAGAKIMGNMVVGDLVFFQTYEPGPSHVGIYLGNGKFAHASSSHGVTVSRLSDSYWAARFLGAKRVVSPRAN
jgi:cell wall-associated NlpC family hydrolase